ncbi:MAG: hypothetical protein ACYC8T_17625 [Myxococcaceae bacterium]
MMRPVLVIKAKAGSPSQLEELRALANETASGLLEDQSDRVLVVYENQAASIYYEGAPAPAPVRAPRVALS